MRLSKPKITYDAYGTPAVWAEHVPQAYFGLGWLHARHRPLQSLILVMAARGELAGRLVPRRQLVMLDALIHRLDIPARALAEVPRLTPRAAEWLDAYVAGFNSGLQARGMPWELRLLMAQAPPMTRQSVLGGLMISAYLGLAEGQEHMERALVDCLHAGGDAETLRHMFTPFLDGWDPHLLAQVDKHVSLGFAAHALRVAGGSNAWAVTGARSASGKPMLCGDPHLQINQMPALFFEARLQVGDDCWLGATIPGLPGLAVGRNNAVAWSGTFACADNVDMTLEVLEHGRVRRRDGDQTPTPRRAVLQRRGLPDLHQTFCETEHGVLQNPHLRHGSTLAVQWAALEGGAEALDAYLALPTATSVDAASAILEKAHTLSLHFILADRSGGVLYQQAGRIPRRRGGWSGLFAVPADDPRRWDGFYTGATLPRGGPEDDMIASANEARLAADGGVLATLAQPPYRLRRIRQVLGARRDHDVASMQALQQDLLSLQGVALQPYLLSALPPGPVREALRTWDGWCTVDSIGAHAFAVAYRAALDGLAPRLGGAWWLRMLHQSEISVWWCRGIDALLQQPSTWTGPAAAGMHAAMAACARQELRPWGEVRQLSLRHFVLGDLPNIFGLNRGPFPLPGSIATVMQGNLVPSFAGDVAVGPAYRMVCDLGSPGIYTAMPGGMDGSCLSNTYDAWIDDYRAGRYHPVLPPRQDEGEVSG